MKEEIDETSTILDNLIELLVDKKIITKKEASKLYVEKNE